MGRTRSALGPGDLMICPPGHDGWFLGDEPCVFIDWTGVAHYAERRRQRRVHPLITRAVTRTEAFQFLVEPGSIEMLGAESGAIRGPSYA